MKKFLAILGACALFFSAVIIISCEGPAGPQGPVGLQGEQGIVGADGTATCILCHDDSQVKFAKTNQWEASVHATGGNYSRNSTSCAPCHTSQGFLERIAAGTQKTAAAIEDPNPINCYTCHAIHSSYTEDDWDLNVETAVTFWHNGESHDFGEGNVCAECHQSRPATPVVLTTALATDSVTLTKSSYGPHHSPQGLMFAGTGGVEFTGSESYVASSHTTMITNACVQCHMAEAYGNKAGGHTWNMGYESHGDMELNTAGCEDCHTDEDALILKVETTAGEVEDLMTSLYGLLVNRGVLTADSSAVTKKMKEIEAGAIYNYKMILEDRSNGVHNGPYAKALLQNSIDAINAL